MHKTVTNLRKQDVMVYYLYKYTKNKSESNGLKNSFY